MKTLTPLALAVTLLAAGAATAPAQDSAEVQRRWRQTHAGWATMANLALGKF